MPILFDYDPTTGMTQHFDFDPITEEIHITHSQNVSHILDKCKEARLNPDIWNKGVKESWAHYATIPAIVEMELAKKGLRLSDKNATKRIIKEIETNYPYCKVTDKKHG